MSNEQLINMCLSGDITGAQNVFNNHLQDRIMTAISQRKSEIAKDILLSTTQPAK